MVSASIPMAKPLLGAEEKEAVLKVLDSGMLAQGKEVEDFEKAFASYIGTSFAIATSNGTTALHAALLAHGIRAGDEVITTPFTFIATANAIKMVGATPVFVDVEENTFNINPSLVEKAITPRTKAILPVHLFGMPAAMDTIMEIAQKYHLNVIEDACQAHGAELLLPRGERKKVGSFGTGCFSFYPTKNMTTSEGGMITTDDAGIAEKVKRLISHHSSPYNKYLHAALGYNFRMTNISAAIGLAQLKKLPLFNNARKQNAKILTEGLASIPGLILPGSYEGHVFHQYTIRVTPSFGLSRDKVAEELTALGIGNSIFYPLPLHKQEAFCEHNGQSFPVAERLAKEVLSIPVHPALAGVDIQKIIAAFKEMREKVMRNKVMMDKEMDEGRQQHKGYSGGCCS
ncbi:MAG TPA: DegT/DnrJ/EryC1/StrS family aminotransferase [Candidatus Nanoarchaeia archaeon]|nr:DegT/DnrJ/EryC1/StrS family aminotransferase [Candidatus Nanoarchaeia archaeon]